MKELTIEEKAKAYDEALEQAKRWHKAFVMGHNYPATDIKVSYEIMFSELKESENERIKREIITYLSTVEDKELTPYESWIAWLEKQGEQKPAVKLELDENGEPILTPFEAELFSMMSDAWQGYLLGEEVNIAEIVKEHSVELLERANEQKAAWGEEDEYTLGETIQHLEELIKIDKVKHCSVDAHYCQREIDWLKSLKERVQPKQEWSEEDNNKINSIKYLLHELGNHNFDNWLESLKDNALSKQKWSEEDEKIYQSIMDDTVQENQLDRKQIDWLKLLKERLKGK